MLLEGATALERGYQNVAANSGDRTQRTASQAATARDITAQAAEAGVGQGGGAAQANLLANARDLSRSVSSAERATPEYQRFAAAHAKLATEAVNQALESGDPEQLAAARDVLGEFLIQNRGAVPDNVYVEAQRKYAGASAYGGDLVRLLDQHAAVLAIDPENPGSQAAFDMYAAEAKAFFEANGGMPERIEQTIAGVESARLLRLSDLARANTPDAPLPDAPGLLGVVENALSDGESEAETEVDPESIFGGEISSLTLRKRVVGNLRQLAFFDPNNAGPQIGGVGQAAMAATKVGVVDVAEIMGGAIPFAQRAAFTVNDAVRRPFTGQTGDYTEWRQTQMTLRDEDHQRYPGLAPNLAEPIVDGYERVADAALLNNPDNDTSRYDAAGTGVRLGMAVTGGMRGVASSVRNAPRIASAASNVISAIPQVLNPANIRSVATSLPQVIQSAPQVARTAVTAARDGLKPYLTEASSARYGIELGLPGGGMIRGFRQTTGDEALQVARNVLSAGRAASTADDPAQTIAATQAAASATATAAPQAAARAGNVYNPLNALRAARTGITNILESNGLYVKPFGSTGSTLRGVNAAGRQRNVAELSVTNNPAFERVGLFRQWRVATDTQVLPDGSAVRVLRAPLEGNALIGGQLGRVATTAERPFSFPAGARVEGALEGLVNGFNASQRNIFTRAGSTMFISPVGNPAMSELKMVAFTTDDAVTSGIGNLLAGQLPAMRQAMPTGGPNLHAALNALPDQELFTYTTRVPLTPARLGFNLSAIGQARVPSAARIAAQQAQQGSTSVTPGLLNLSPTDFAALEAAVNDRNSFRIPVFLDPKNAATVVAPAASLVGN